jgi:hypothetical protein
MTVANPLQAIVDIAEQITINRRRMIGIQYTRNQIVRTSATPTRNPWRFSVKVSAAIAYTDARELLEAIDFTDRDTAHQITFSNNPGLSYIFAYRGDMTGDEITNIIATQFIGKEMIVQNLPDRLSPAEYIFKQGDIIQLYGRPYPFTVTDDVQRGSSTAVIVPVHRPNFLSNAVNSEAITVGNDVSFNMICTNMPTYVLMPGTNGAYIQFSGDFELYEDTGEA